MASDLIYDDTGKLIAIACGSPWGIGTYYHCHDEECFCEGRVVYGIPPRPMNPEDFRPDEESCTTAEIAAWREALATWRVTTHQREED